MYFTHSFALHPEDPAHADAWTDHGGAFVAAVVDGNVSGVQFHPEKSQGAGARLLGNFLKWRP
jgi:glutamine amidotransferase